MSDQECSNCARLEAEVENLRGVIDTLRAELARIRDLARAALSILGALLFSLKLLIRRCETVLAQKSGIPRGQWAFTKGIYILARRAAEQIEDAMNYLKQV